MRSTEKLQDGCDTPAPRAKKLKLSPDETGKRRAITRETRGVVGAVSEKTRFMLEAGAVEEIGQEVIEDALNVLKPVARNDQGALEVSAQPSVPPSAPPRDADKTPIPYSDEQPTARPIDRPPSRVGGGGGGNDGDGPKRPESGQLEAIVTPSHVLEAVGSELQARNILVECPHMVDAAESIRLFRNHHFSPQEVRRHHDLQNSDLMTDEVTKDGRRWYGFLGLHRLYDGGRIPLENIGIIAKTQAHRLNGRRRGDGTPYFDEIDSIFAQFDRTEDGYYVPKKDENGKVVPGTFLEIGPGNGDLIIRARKWAEVERARPLRSVRQAMEQAKSMIDKAAILPNIMALDYTQEFVTHLRSKRKVNAQCGDICAKPEELFGSTELKPGSVDFFAGVLWLDRVENMVQAIENIRYMARPNGSSRAVLGVLLPFEPTSDVVTQNQNVKRVPFWDPNGDIRQQFMANVEVMELFQQHAELSKDDSVRAQIIFNLVMRLNEMGIIAENIGEVPYEVYSPHCIIEPAGVIREKYEYLRDIEFDDPNLQEMNRAVFQDPEQYPNDRIVGYPQRYKLLLLGCRVRPKNGKRFSDSGDAEAGSEEAAA